LILTGARLREILHLKWDYVDLERGLLLLPDSKTGRKAIVLNLPALAVLSSLDRKGQYVIFSEQDNKPRADLNRPWRTISTRANLQGDGCDGLSTLAKEWGAHVGDVLSKEGIGVLVLDSYTTRYVDRSCGLSDQHWGRRRADDAYSALNYLIDKKLAKADEVSIMGFSNGGLASLMAMTKKLDDHPHHFAAGFPIVPKLLERHYKVRRLLRPNDRLCRRSRHGKSARVVLRNAEEEAGDAASVDLVSRR
jgi:hypothetical protein